MIPFVRQVIKDVFEAKVGVYINNNLCIYLHNLFGIIKIEFLTVFSANARFRHT